MTTRNNLDGPIKFEGLDDRWVRLGKWQYGEDYYVHPDSEVYSDVYRTQWIYPGGLIATLDYYVRKEGYGDAEDQWQVIEKVHFYDPDEGFHQIIGKHFQHGFYPATPENLEVAKNQLISLMGHRDNSHLTAWWEEWREEL